MWPGTSSGNFERDFLNVLSTWINIRAYAHQFTRWTALHIVYSVQTGLGTEGSLPHMKEPPSKIRIGSQRAVACSRTCKSGDSAGHAIHAMLSSSLEQVLKLPVTSSCPRLPHPQHSLCSYFSFSLFLYSSLNCLWFISVYFFQFEIFIRARWPDFFPASLKCRTNKHITTANQAMRREIRRVLNFTWVSQTHATCTAQKMCRRLKVTAVYLTYFFSYVEVTRCVVTCAHKSGSTWQLF